MRRSASGSRVSDQFSQARPSHSRSMSRSQSVRLVEDAGLHSPRYDPSSSSQSGMTEKSRSRSAEYVVYFIPLVLVLCVIILWLFSRSAAVF